MLGRTMLYSAYFGDGSDGDLTVASSKTVEIGCVQDGEQIYKQYNNLTIEAGGVLKPSNRCNGMVLLVKGDLTVNGTISVDKCAPLQNGNEDVALSEPHVRLCNLTGGRGGDGGGDTTGLTLGGMRGVGGEGHGLGGGFPGGGGSAHGWVNLHSENGICTKYNAGDGAPRPPAGIMFPYPASTTSNGLYGAGASFSTMRGGAAPGGGGAYVASNCTNGNPGVDGDGYPGGAVWIFVRGKVVIGSAGVITANGGNGGDGASGNSSQGVMAYGGGGGGGGIVALIYNKEYTNNGTIRANGGVGGAGGGNGGGVGSVLVTTLMNLLRSAE